jgi:hypothetical protein
MNLGWTIAGAVVGLLARTALCANPQPRPFLTGGVMLGAGPGLAS